MDYFRVKNWDKYQHRDALRGLGPMPWIRVQTSILSDDKIIKLTAHQKYLWFIVLLTAGTTRNRVGTDCVHIAHTMGTRRLPNIQFMWDLGLIEPYDASQRREGRSAAAPLREEKSRVIPRLSPINFEHVFSDSEEEELWEIYPKRETENTPRQTFDRLLRKCFKHRSQFEELQKAVKNYSSAGREAAYVKSFQNFLKDDHWKQYVEQTPYVSPLSVLRPD